MPSAITRPWSITAIRSASWSASSRYWVVSSSVVPSRTSSRTIVQIWLRLRGSSPVVGSSRNRIRGLRQQARGEVEPASHPARSRCAPGGRRRRRDRSARAARRRAGAPPPGRGRTGGRTSRGSRARSASRRPQRTGRSARSARGRRPARCATSWPRTSARPASGGTSVERIRTRVVLPAPFGPSSPKTAPSGTSRSTPASACGRAEALRDPLDPDRRTAAPQLWGLPGRRHGHLILGSDA